jgi:hypothetical protein
MCFDNWNYSENVLLIINDHINDLRDWSEFFLILGTLYWYWGSSLIIDNVSSFLIKWEFSLLSYSSSVLSNNVPLYCYVLFKSLYSKSPYFE